MRPNLCPPEGAIGKSREEGHGVRKISLAPRENIEGRVLRRDDGASFGVVADALTSYEPRSSRRGWTSVGGRVGNCASEIEHVRSPVLGVLHRRTSSRADLWAAEQTAERCQWTDGNELVIQQIRPGERHFID